MFQRKPGRFRSRQNGRGHGHPRRSNNNGHSMRRSDSFSNGPRNNFRPTQSAEKLLEKYSTLAKEAISSGDRTLSENYLQHADHYMRVIEDKNRNKIQNKVETKTLNETTTSSETSIPSETSTPSDTQDSMLDQNAETKKII